MMRFFNNISVLVVIISFPLMATQCNAQNTFEESKLENVVWMHSYEEDTDSVKVFRLQSYDFPSSRGRTGFQLKEGKSFINYEIAPTDGIAERKGSCIIEGGKMVISFEDVSRNYTMEIVSIENGILRIKK